jgi:hypothetical protein
VEPGALLIDFDGAATWIPRAETDYDQRLKQWKSANQKKPAQEKGAQARQTAAIQRQQRQANAEWQSQLADYVSPLERAPYDYQRSVVDYYDWRGNRYNIGVFGQRIYN